MPIFEYTCSDCNNSFELLVIHEEEPLCPSCSSNHVTKQYSRFGMGNNAQNGTYGSLPLYNSGGCCCNPGSCGCKN